MLLKTATCVLTLMVISLDNGQCLNELPFLQLNSSVNTEEVGHFLNENSHAVLIPHGFPFEDRLHSALYISVNGIISFSEPMYLEKGTSFPGQTNDIFSKYLVAPFWDDIDIRKSGNVFYEAHDIYNRNSNSDNLISQVSEYIEEETGKPFSGEWMLLVQWDQVHPWPHGEDPLDLNTRFRNPDYNKVNTFQAVLITNGTSSYAVFTYHCGSLGWSRFSTVIGYNAAGWVHQNHPFSGVEIRDMICMNTSTSNWSNVLYDLTAMNKDIEPELPMHESTQKTYLPILQILNISTSKTLDACDNCNSGPIDLSGQEIPFGRYYHKTVYISVNGFISFSYPLALENGENFPPANGKIYTSHILSPYWTNIDTRRAGSVRYETYFRGDSEASDRQMDRVETFLAEEENVTFEGEWMLLVSWDNVHPYPHGSSFDQERESPYLESTNSFQAIVISDFNKTYAIFTYNCDDMEWSGEATIGYNAANYYKSNHPLSGKLDSHHIGCADRERGQETSGLVNNIVYDLVVFSELCDESPPPPKFLGNCSSSYTGTCCNHPKHCKSLSTYTDCMCDQFCHFEGDCCSDYNYTFCNRGSDPYLIIANGNFIYRTNLSGENFHVISHHPERLVVGIDYDYRRGFMYWSDLESHQILRSGLNGSNEKVIVNGTHKEIVDIAIDWVANNLYWTETVTNRIEVMDLDTLERTVLIDTGIHSVPRGIAVDPDTRELFWTDRGDSAGIRKSSMDGSGVASLHTDFGVNGITVDVSSKYIYWTSGTAIYRSLYDGGDFGGLPVHHSPFSIAILNIANIISTDTINSNVYNWDEALKHKPFLRYQTLHGIALVSEINQPVKFSHPCQDSANCSHLCLLSSTDPRGFKCACPEGFFLLPDGYLCEGNVTDTRPEVGSCRNAGFAESQCCSPLKPWRFCAGSYPHNCFCDFGCWWRNDCCHDADITCPNKGSCRMAGYEGCCNTVYSSCRGHTGLCQCDVDCTVLDNCCLDFEELCHHPPGSCVMAGYSQCCTSGSCFGHERNCKCDFSCRIRGDCCSDIDKTCSAVPVTDPPATLSSIRPSKALIASSATQVNSLDTTIAMPLPTAVLDVQTSSVLFEMNTIATTHHTVIQSLSHLPEYSTAIPTLNMDNANTDQRAKKGAITGGIVGGVIVVMAIVVTAAVIFWRTKTRKEEITVNVCEATNPFTKKPIYKASTSFNDESKNVYENAAVLRSLDSTESKKTGPESESEWAKSAYF